ncbi:MAG: hypothetical protein SF069_16385 [Phycisphaerae bacterium]|nr:hypothetical protein [Phycisphaerae bacterium]
MGRLIAVVGSFALFAAGLYWFTSNLKEKHEEDRLLPIGYGAVAGGELEVNISVTNFMVQEDPPPPREDHASTWIDWIPQHFSLKDSSGTIAQWNKQGNSQLIKGVDAGIAEFYITTRIKAGEKYTLEYIPNVAAKHRYRYEFRGWTNGPGFERAALKLVKR